MSRRQRIEVPVAQRQSGGLIYRVGGGSIPPRGTRPGLSSGAGTSLTKKTSRVRSSTPVPHTTRLWPSGFRHRSSKAIHAGSSPARRSTPRSFNGRTKVFEAFYVGSIPALGTNSVLAWCRVHRRIYKPLRSRLEHGLGSTPSASTMRSKLIRMSSRFLIGRQLVRFQPDAPNSGTVAEW